VRAQSIDDERGIAAIASAERGELGAATEIAAQPSEEVDPASRAWIEAARAACRIAGLRARDASPLEVVATWSAAAPIAVAHAALGRARESSIALDLGAAEAALAIARSAIEAGSGSSTALHLETELRSGLCGVLAGTADEAQVAALRTHAQTAAAEGHAGRVVELHAVRALALLAAGDLDEGLALARRASRMSRTEGLPQPEYLAHLVLARARRQSNRPYFALRILRALVSVVGGAWRPWLAWEWQLAGGERSGVDPSAPGAGPFARSLDAALCAAHDVNAAAFRREIAALATLLAPRSPLRSDVEIVRGALDPHLDRTALHDAIAPWRTGASGSAPAGITALVPFEQSARGTALVIARPGAAAERLLAPGAAMWEAENGPAIAIADELGGSRTQLLLGELLFAGDAGIAEDELFRSAYGFAFRREMHARILNVALHRVRATLGSAGTLERTESRARVVVHTPIKVIDPRCAPGLEERMLRFLAQRPTTSARAAATDLGVPLRSAQQVLEALVEDGACVRDRNGRQIDYRIEDTTFQEPTSPGLSLGR
jgi:hypothetical protein